MFDWLRKKRDEEPEEDPMQCPACGNKATLDVTAIDDDAPRRLCQCGRMWAPACPDET